MTRLIEHRESMLDPATAQKARDAANSHVRLQLVSVDALPGFEGGPCKVEMRVARVFRSNTPLSGGDPITLRVYCYVPPDGSPTGPTWLDYSKLKPPALLEAFLNRTRAGTFDIAMFQIAFTAATGEEPESNSWGVGQPDGR